MSDMEKDFATAHLEAGIAALVVSMEASARNGEPIRASMPRNLLALVQELRKPQVADVARKLKDFEEKLEFLRQTVNAHDITMKLGGRSRAPARAQTPNEMLGVKDDGSPVERSAEAPRG